MDLSSLTPELMADKVKKVLSNSLVIISAKVVFPTPGGPQKIMEGILLFFNAFLIGPFSPTKCSCPIKSFRFKGLIRSANGV